MEVGSLSYGGFYHILHSKQVCEVCVSKQSRSPIHTYMHTYIHHVLACSSMCTIQQHSTEQHDTLKIATSSNKDRAEASLTTHTIYSLPTAVSISSAMTGLAFSKLLTRFSRGPRSKCFQGFARSALAPVACLLMPFPASSPGPFLPSAAMPPPAAAAPAFHH